MKICYTPKRFRALSMSIIEQADQIMRQYAQDGYDLTLRQLYYQFIARDLFPGEWADKRTGSKNSEASYDRLGSLVNDARLAGLLDWEYLVDRTRPLRQATTWDSPKQILEAATRGYQLDPWKEQPFYVEVWVEKDALLGVVAGVADRWRVPYLACRGYFSQSAQWRAAQRLWPQVKRGKMVRVIHLGDHDPSGIDMSRDNADRLDLMAGEGIVVKRLALNMNQVEQYAPPPNPTKITDSRANGYIERFGEECWELDALEPQVIEGLIEGAIAECVNTRAWRRSMEQEEANRSRLSALTTQWVEDGV